jgi:methionyl-tRNA formyltransferase
LDKSAQIAAALLEGLLRDTAAAASFPKGKPQEGEPSYTKTISKDDALINWNDSAVKIAAAVRAYTNEPGSWTRIGGESGETLKILKAAPLGRANDFASLPAGTVAAFDKKQGILVKCGQGLLCVTELQRQQKKAMGWKDFMNGARDFVGTRLV